MITFVIPSINRKTLPMAIASLWEQTNRDWKAIIVYDGVKGINFPYHDNIRTINIKKTGRQGKANGEAGLVRNEGIKLVDTEWIGFLDDDDTLGSRYVELLKKKYSHHDFVLWRMINKHLDIIPRYGRTRPRFGNIGISFCYKKKLDVFFDENGVGEDFDFVQKLMKKTDNYTITPEIMYMVGK